MRTREYNTPTLLDESTKNVVASGYSVRISDGRQTAASGAFPAYRKLYDRKYGFFVDEPHRPRATRRFGEASRWEEVCTPSLSSLTIHDRTFRSKDGLNNTNVKFTPADRWYIVDPLCGLVYNDLNQERSYGPWVYRWRSRVSLNNAVQRQRQRMFAYNGGLSETLGELPECPSLFKLVNTAKGIRSNLTGLALGIRFGWMPLVSTFQAALAELRAWMDGADALRQRRGIQTLRYSGPDDWSLVEANNPIYAISDPTRYYEEFRKPKLVAHEGSITYSAVVDMRPYYDGRAWQIMSRLARVGGIPSIRTLWELLPKSFIVDWFVSIGDVISDIQGNLLYHMDVKEQCWSWKLHDRLDQELHEFTGSYRLTTQDVKAFYRSNTPPLGSWKVPKISVPTDPGRLSSLALIVSQKIPDRGMSLKSLLRLLNRAGYR